MKLLFEDCVKVKKKIYFICRDFNIICAMDIEDGEISIIGSLPEGNVYSWRMGAKIIYWNDNLYFSPMCAEKIWKLDLKTNEWVGYPRKELDKKSHYGEMFQAILFKEKIYFIGCCYPAIIIYDLKTEEMEYVTDPYNSRKNLIEEKKECWFRTDYVQIGSDIYMASCVDNAVFRFNLDTYDYEYIKVGEKSFRYAGIDWDGKSFYLPPRTSGPIVIWDGDESISMINTGIETEDTMAVFGGTICLDDKIAFPACFSKNTVEITRDTEFRVKRLDEQFLFFKKIDSETIASLNIDGTFTILHNGITYTYKTFISDEVLGKYIKERMDGNQRAIDDIECESEMNTLGLFLNKI